MSKVCTTPSQLLRSRANALLRTYNAGLAFALLLLLLLLLFLGWNWTHCSKYCIIVKFHHAFSILHQCMHLCPASLPGSLAGSDRSTYFTILKRAWSANFKMVRYVLLRPRRPELDNKDVEARRLPVFLHVLAVYLRRILRPQRSQSGHSLRIIVRFSGNSTKLCNKYYKKENIDFIVFITNSFMCRFFLYGFS
jgi:hypothetical protein